MENVLQDLTIIDLFQNNMINNPDSISLKCVGNQVTYRQLNSFTNKIANGLINYGIETGDVVLIASSNFIQSVYILYSLMKLGAVSVIVNPALSTREILHINDKVNPKYVICEDIFIEEKNIDFNNVILINNDSYIRISHCDEEFKKVDFSSKDPSIIVFSSGTTGLPKAIPLTQFALINSAINLGNCIEAKSSDCFLAFLPIHHTFCIIVNILIPLVYGSSVSIPADTSTDSVLSTVQCDKCTILSGTPTMFHSLVSKDTLEDYNLTSLRAGFIGGSSCSKVLFNNIEKRLGIKLLPTLGMSESSGGYTCTNLSDSSYIRRTTVGKPMDFIEVSIQENNELLASNITGEICVRGYLVMDGYWSKPEKNLEIISEDGWLRTGDMGFLDDQGFLHFLGRKKNLIIRGGENINPYELEELIKSIDFVDDCVVVGVPDDHYNEVVCACIIAKEGKTIDFEKIKQRLSNELIYYKLPKYYFEFNEFPKTSIGKNCINEIREEVIKLKGGEK